MDKNYRNEAEKLFDSLFQQVTEQKEKIKSLQDDDLLLVCCLMAEINKKIRLASEHE